MAAVRKIYLESFPSSERKPIAALDEMLQRSDYAVVLIEDAELPIGFAIVFTPQDPSDAALLEYLAIDARYHGNGAGSALVRTLIDLLGDRPMLIEVESDIGLSAQRRRAFYRRLGFKQLAGLSFILPLPDAPPMELMLIHPPVTLSRKILARWLTNIYQLVYACPPDDPRIEQMLQTNFNLE